MSDTDFYFDGFGQTWIIDIGENLYTFTPGDDCSQDDFQLGEWLYFPTVMLALFGTPTTLAAIFWD